MSRYESTDVRLYPVDWAASSPSVFIVLSFSIGNVATRSLFHSILGYYEGMHAWRAPQHEHNRTAAVNK